MKTHTNSQLAHIIDVCTKISEALAACMMVIPEREKEIRQLLETFTALKYDEDSLAKAISLIEEAQAKQQDLQQNMVKQTKLLTEVLQGILKTWSEAKKTYKADMEHLDHELQEAKARDTVHKVREQLKGKK